MFFLVKVNLLFGQSFKYSSVSPCFLGGYITLPLEVVATILENGGSF